MSELLREAAFEDLKEALTCDPILRAPDFNRPFVLQTDASAQGIGAVLAQIFEDGERPVAYFSQKLLPARYTATEKECLALV